MRKIRVSLITIALLLTIGGTCFAQQIIPWDDADAYYGQFVKIEGTIVAASNSDKACFLNFHSSGNQYFSAVILRSDFDKFPSSPEEYYNGKKVHVTGFIRGDKGKPEIILKNPSQIEILK